jgi:hypothetical protein
MDEVLARPVTDRPQTKTVEIPVPAALSPWAGEVLPRLLDELRQEYPRLTFSLVLDRSARGPGSDRKVVGWPLNTAPPSGAATLPPGLALECNEG